MVAVTSSPCGFGPRGKMLHLTFFLKRALSRFVLVLSVGVLAVTFAISATAAGQVSKMVYDSIMEARARVDVKDYEGAIAILEPLSLRSGLSGYEKANVLNYIGFSYYNMEDIPRTIQMYEEMLTIPQLDEATRKQTIYTLTQLYTMQEQYDLALAKMREWRWLETDPSPESFVLHAQILFKLERYAEMVPDLKAAITLTERNGQQSKEDWWTMLRFALEELGRRDELASVHEQIVRRWPAEANVERAVLGFFMAGDAERFIDGAERLLADFPDSEAVYPIHIAAARGDDDLIRRLVATGATVELESSVGLTPLTIAARFGLGSTVDLLLELGARVDGSGDPASTPIIHAAGGGHPAIVERLWHAGADLDLYAKGEIKILPLLARTGDADVLRKLSRANPALLETSGPQALAQAARYASVPAFDALLDLGATPVETATRSTLGAALVGGNTDIIATLVALGADLDAPVRDWASPLHVAVHYGHTDTVRWLLDKGVDVDRSGDDGVPALTRAIIGRRSDIVDLLVAAGAGLASTGVRDYDALMLAAQVRNEEVVAVLLEAGAQPQGKLAKLARWKRRDVRNFLKQHDFERVANGDEETWSAPAPQGKAVRVVLPRESRSYSLSELIRMVRESRLTLNAWLTAV